LSDQTDKQRQITAAFNDDHEGTIEAEHFRFIFINAIGCR